MQQPGLGSFVAAESAAAAVRDCEVVAAEAFDRPLIESPVPPLHEWRTADRFSCTNSNRPIRIEQPTWRETNPSAPDSVRRSGVVGDLLYLRAPALPALGSFC